MLFWYIKPFSHSIAEAATALRNMLDALDWIDYCNEIRANEGLAPLKATDGMMASAQRNANFSTYCYAHASKASGSMDMAETRGSASGENLYYTRMGKERAYLGWYDAEKAIWEDAVAQNPDLAQCKTNAYQLMLNDYNTYLQVSRYLNIVNPDYTVTGIGLNSGGRGAAIQQFMRHSSSAGTVYTVAVYRERLSAYYKQYVEDTEATLSAAQDALAQAQQAQAEAQAALDEAKGTATDAATALEGAQSALATARANVEQKGADKTEAQRSCDDAAQAYEDARAETTRRQAEVEDAQSAYDQARTTAEATQATYEQKASAAEQASQQLAQAQNALDALTDLGVADIAVVETQAYTGSALCPLPTVMLDDTGLVAGIDYTVAHEANTMPGQARLTVTGTGDLPAVLRSIALRYIKTFSHSARRPTSAASSKPGRGRRLDPQPPRTRFRARGGRAGSPRRRLGPPGP